MGHVTIKTKVIALAVLVVGVIGSYNVSVKGLLQKDTQTQTVDTVLEFQREILRRDIARYPVEVMLENAKYQIVQKEEAEKEKEEAAKLAVQQEEERQRILNSTTYVWSEVSTPTYGQSYASITCDEIGLSSRLYWGDDQSMINTAQGVYEYTGTSQIGYPGCHLLAAHNSSVFSLLQCFCVIFGKLAVKAFAKMLSKGEINYPVAEYKTPKKLLLQEAAAINQSPNAPLTASVFGNWIDFEADWQNCLSIHNGILQSRQIFKKLILVQDNFTYKELDYENNSELGIGVKTFAAGSTTTIGRMKGHKLIYNIGINLSNGRFGVNGYSIDTLDVTNEVHKWLADHGYTRTD